MSNRSKQGWKTLVLALTIAAAPAIVTAPAARADDGPGCQSCQHFHCPHTKYCPEGTPHICFQHGCGKPVMSPCISRTGATISPAFLLGPTVPIGPIARFSRRHRWYSPPARPWSTPFPRPAHHAAEPGWSQHPAEPPPPRTLE